MLPDKYGIHEKTVKKADGSYRSLPMLRIHYYFLMWKFAMSNSEENEKWRFAAHFVIHFRTVQSFFGYRTNNLESPYCSKKFSSQHDIHQVWDLGFDIRVGLIQ